MKARATYLLRRLLLMIVSLWGLVSLTFLLVAVTPSDPARAVAGPYATDEQIAAKAAELGLDQPLGARYLNFMGDLLSGSLGKSIYDGKEISAEIARLIPATLELILLSLVVAVILGLGLGAISAYFHRTYPDRISSGVVAVLQSLPDFVLAVVLIYVFSFLLGAAPGPEGQLSIITIPPPRVTGMTIVDSALAGDSAAFSDAVSHAILPVLTLGLVIAAVFARISRAALRESLEADQTKFARACGLPEWQVLQYAFLSSRTPILTYGAMIFGSLIGGTAIVETVFNWNGLSQWAIGSMQRTDYPAIQGFVLVAGAITLVTYAILDIVTALLDPRIKAFQRA